MGKDATFVAPLYDWTSAIADSDLTPTQRHVALTFALHLNKRTRTAFPGASLLSRETGLHRSTVKRTMRELVQLGWLRCVVKGGIVDGRRLAAVYMAVIPNGVTENPVSCEPGSLNTPLGIGGSPGLGSQGAPNHQGNYSYNPGADEEAPDPSVLRESAPSQLRALRDTLRNVNEEVA